MQKIANAIVGYMAGDAYGVPWEGMRADTIDIQVAPELPQRESWPKGATSDDTEQLLLVIRLVIEGYGEVDSYAFMHGLISAESHIRGIGPSTAAALEAFQHHGDVRCGRGRTNGAAMRVLPLGWVWRAKNAARRREAVYNLSRTTHGYPEATVAAQIVAAMATASLVSNETETLVQAARLEIGHWMELVDCASAVETLEPAFAGEATFGTLGVSLDAVETVAAVVHILVNSRTIREVYDRAILLGGDTDTVAAIAGGLAAPMYPSIETMAPWITNVMNINRLKVAQFAADLANIRSNNLRL